MNSCIKPIQASAEVTWNFKYIQEKKSVECNSQISLVWTVAKIKRLTDQTGKIGE